MPGGRAERATTLARESATEPAAPANARRDTNPSSNEYAAPARPGGRVGRAPLSNGKGKKGSPLSGSVGAVAVVLPRSVRPPNEPMRTSSWVVPAGAADCGAGAHLGLGVARSAGADRAVAFDGRRRGEAARRRATRAAKRRKKRCGGPRKIEGSSHPKRGIAGAEFRSARACAEPGARVCPRAHQNARGGAARRPGRQAVLRGARARAAHAAQPPGGARGWSAGRGAEEGRGEGRRGPGEGERLGGARAGVPARGASRRAARRRPGWVPKGFIFIRRRTGACCAYRRCRPAASCVALQRRRAGA